MRSVLVLTAAVLGAIGVGIGAMAAAGEAPLAAPASHTPVAKAPRASGICAEITSISGAVVDRVVALPQNHPTFSFPAVVPIESAAAAQQVAELLCSLPAFPRGVMSCPVDVGISYNIVFSVGASSETVSVNPWGCEGVSGDISPRWLATSPSFWSELGSAMGLQNATRSTFAGTIPGM
ncbi:MAG TPA: hypothetical protein VEH29_06460 [Acidimicrobiales bacterium]|nr:hypothetical protein [Acidimicrobiales bacterium]